MSIWIDPEETSVPEALHQAVGGHPLVAAILARRGYADVESARAFLDPTCYTPASPFALPDMAEAVARLERAIATGARVCVWGDFDVDGQTATTLLVAALRDLGADVTHHIPEREKESHGVNIPVLSRLLDEGVQLVLTCDTGVAAHEAVDYAAARGVDVIVTDHHDLPPALPHACAIVNPKRLPVGHPMRELPGVGVAYKLAEALYSHAGRAGDVMQYLDLVALGIVVDVAVQTGDTRYLLQRGLEALRRTGRLGLLAMMEYAEINPVHLAEDDVAFGLGPRLNALGRLADANVAVEFLTTGDLERARIYAAQLEGLNAQRRLLSDQVYDGAQAQIDRDPSLREHAALVLAHPAWHAGVLGIVASRLVERYRKPVVLFTTLPGGLGRGSARSVEGCDITAAIAAHREMLAGFGGHTMAAGLSIDPARIDEFRRALSRTVRAMLGEAAEKPTLHIDGYLSLPDISFDLANDLGRLAPFGPGNPPLTLASRGLKLSSHRTIDREGRHLLLTVEDDEGISQPVIWWRGEADALPTGRFDLAYTLRVSDYKGERQLQILWVEARPVEAPAGSVEAARAVEVIDCRGERDLLAALARLRTENREVLVWAEGEDREAVGGRGRDELGPAPALAIWTAPPGLAELREGVERVLPQKVYLFGVNSGLDHCKTFLKRLAGLVQHALSSKAGQADLARLAAKTAQRERTVRKGLAWLVARGDITILGEDGGVIELAQGGQPAPDELARIEEGLKALLAETAAYRDYFAHTDKDALF